MKKLLLVSAFLFSVAFANAQSIIVMNMSQRCCYNGLVDPYFSPVCYEPETLEAISKEMYDAGNDYYIFVDLLKDGLIQENQVYEFNITLETNGYDELIPAELHKKYVDKWSSFVKMHSGKKENFYSWHGVIIKPGQLLNPQSSFRQLNKYSLWQHGFRQKEYKYIIQEILVDKLAEPDELYSYELSDSVLRINNRTVLEPLRTKYYNLYKDLLGMAITKDGYSGFSSGTGTTMYGSLLKE